MIRFAALGSGSRGNALVIESGMTRVLLDCGFGPREMTRRLTRLGLRPDDIHAVLVTHEHTDHVGGVLPCARQFGWPVYASYGTAVAGRITESGATLRLISGDRQFALGDLCVHPFAVPHDAREPLQFAFTDGTVRLGVLTDTGELTPHLIAQLARCDALVLECNHDDAMLTRGNYPASLKRRIAGRLGHLANSAAAALLGKIKHDRLQHLIAAHLSEKNNTPMLARSALATELGCDPAWIGIAGQDAGFDWRSVS